MIPPVPDGLGAQMVFILILKPESTYMIFPGQQFFQPLTDFFVPANQSVFRHVVQHVGFDIDIKSQLLSQNMGRSKLRAFRLIADNAHILVNNRLIGQGVLYEVSADEFPNVLPVLFRDTHQFFLLGIREQDFTDHVVPVIVPGSQLLHCSVTTTFP